MSWIQQLTTWADKSLHLLLLKSSMPSLSAKMLFYANVQTKVKNSRSSRKKIQNFCFCFFWLSTIRQFFATKSKTESQRIKSYCCCCVLHKTPLFLAPEGNQPTFFAICNSKAAILKGNLCTKFISWKWRWQLFTIKW